MCTRNIMTINMINMRNLIECGCPQHNECKTRISSLTTLFIEFWKNNFEPSLLENKEPHDTTRRAKEDDDEVDDDVDDDGQDDKDDEDNDDGENILPMIHVTYS